MSYPTGRHFLQIPGPTNVPDRVLRAIDAPTIDHRGPAFQALALEIVELLGPVLGTKAPVVIYPASGTGAWDGQTVGGLIRIVVAQQQAVELANPSALSNGAAASWQMGRTRTP
jgi:aspartate aminotransferase-like enzyme